MQKHILDRPAKPSPVTPGRLIAIKKSAMPRKASLLLQRRARTRLSELRTRNFLKIARS